MSMMVPIYDQRIELRRKSDRMTHEEMRASLQHNFLAGVAIAAVLFGAVMLFIGIHLGRSAEMQKQQIVSNILEAK